MKRLSFALAVISILGIMPANAQQLSGNVATDAPSTSFWLATPVGSDDRGRFFRFVVNDHRLHQDNVGLRNRDFENFSVDSFNASGSAAMRTKTRGLAAAARASQTRHMTAAKAIHITGPWF